MANQVVAKNSVASGPRIRVRCIGDNGDDGDSGRIGKGRKDTGRGCESLDIGLCISWAIQ